LAMTYHDLECETCDEDFYVCDHIYKAINQRGHIVDLDAMNWTLEHPLACREAGLLSCPMNDILGACRPGVDRPLVGRYKMSIVDETPGFEQLDS